MCGIAGIVDLENRQAGGNIEVMLAALGHRGPDDEGYLLADLSRGNWVACSGGKTIRKLSLPSISKEKDGTYNLALGHRRLSIIDLSPAGHQPMSNEDGSLWIVHNGEIYNYLEIRKELELLGHHLRSQTDTEVILNAYEEWGTNCLGRFNGMWAFAIVDLKRNKIFCSRDRTGVKPFYYLYDGKRFCFSSEIKALIQIENFPVEPNEQMVADYLSSGLLDHTQETFFKNIYQLRPGECLLFENNRVSVESYWDIDAKEVRFAKESEYSERFYELLQDSVRLRLRSDVPIGSCLSGGLDSSSIVCLANKIMFDDESIDRKLVGERQKTFSSCFEDLAYDERKFIELVIRQTGAEKNYVFPRAESLFKDMTKLVWHQETPFGSTSVYSQWNVMRLAKERGVTVLLDGQGADELLAGYLPSFYFLFTQALKQVDLGSLIRGIKGFRKHHKEMFVQWMPRMFATIVPNWIKPLFQRLSQDRIGWAEERFRKRYFRTFPRPKKFAHDLNNYLYHIFRSMILPGLLHYEDRNSMAFSLETRLPFLDYRLVEFIFGLPFEQKIGQGVTKVILRDAMKGTLPEEIRNRMDKMGFVTPEDIWFRTVLRNQIYEIISSKSFAERGYFDVDKVQEAFKEHCGGKRNISFIIWRWVSLELWMRTFLDGGPSSGKLGRNDYTS